MLTERSLLCAGFVVLSVACCGAAHAGLPVSWDLRMGPSLTGATDALADSLDRNAVGFDAGVAVRWPRSTRTLGIQGELLVAMRSRSFEDMGTVGFGDELRFRRSLRVVYAQVPLLARAALHSTGKVRPYVLAGPYFAWRMASGIEPGRYVGDEPINPGDVRAQDAGAILGVGIDVVAGSGRATFELRAGSSFWNLLEDRTRVEGTYRVLTLMLGFTPTKQAD